MASLQISLADSPLPYGALALAFYLNIAVEFVSDQHTALLDNDSKNISDPSSILDALGQAANITADSAKTASFLTIAHGLATTTVYGDMVNGCDSLDNHLAYRTFLVAHSVSIADWAIWGAIKSSTKALGVLKAGHHPHLSRWYAYIEGLPSTQAALAKLTEAKSSKTRSNRTAASFALGLPNAVDGRVVTRFPPEPSGYLHIGHAKAAILNSYFAAMYHGRFIVRFDDTNPTKEREEFEQTILEDLQMMDIRGDVITHTSDHFEALFDYAIVMIKRGKAYCDDTEQAEMRAQRMDGHASKRRDATVEQNLARFREMSKGTDEGKRWCLRAKISVDDPNKAMRDPVIYRCNDLPHHRTGTMWKVYPIYDFACPVVDSIEGVTHALRTNEYRDRNPQYKWMLDALGLRQVEIWDFSRLNFVYTLLSKRKLHWFVDNGLVRGWDDPRFPTIRGIRRRGLTVEAIRQYMLLQGPSQSPVSLEWDSIWTINKKIIDPVAPRLWALTSKALVSVTITSKVTEELKALPRHKKNPDVGTKMALFSSLILVEQEDAASFEDQEEITLMDWGNAFVRKKTVSPAGEITGLEMELHLDGDFKKTKKKITWLAAPTQSRPFVALRLLDYDYLITKDKLEDTDELKAFVTPQTEFVTEAVGDANVLALHKGEIIQFERKGYYIYDGTTGAAHDFICIPDGRVASIASKAAPAPATATKKPMATQSGPTATGLAKAKDQSGLGVAAETKMYDVSSVYGDDPVPKPETTMYKVASVYEA